MLAASKTLIPPAGSQNTAAPVPIIRNGGVQHPPVARSQGGKRSLKLRDGLHARADARHVVEIRLLHRVRD